MHLLAVFKISNKPAVHFEIQSLKIEDLVTSKHQERNERISSTKFCMNTKVGKITGAICEKTKDLEKDPK